MHPTRKKNEAGGDGAQLSRREESLKNAALLPRTRAQCARTIYSNLVFLLSHLSHTHQKASEQSRKSHQTNSLKRRDAMMPFEGFELKYINNILNTLITSHFQQVCDTCDSKNTKTPVLCAYTRTREDLSLIHI